MKKRLFSITLIALVLVLALFLGGCNAFLSNKPTPPPAENGSGDGILLQGKAILEVLDTPSDEIGQLFGQEADDFNSFFEVAGMTFHARNGTISQIDIPDAGMLTKDGTPLNAGRDGIVGLIGEPYAASDSEELGSTYSAYYDFAGFSLSLYSRDPDGTEWDAVIRPNGLTLAE